MSTRQGRSALNALVGSGRLPDGGLGRSRAVVSLGNTGATMARRCSGSEDQGVGARRRHSCRHQGIASGRRHQMSNAAVTPVTVCTHGAIYYSSLTGTPFPTVGLLNVGEAKNDLVVEAHRLLASSDLNFIGNVEEGHTVWEGRRRSVRQLRKCCPEAGGGVGAALFDMIKRRRLGAPSAGWQPGSQSLPLSM